MKVIVTGDRNWPEEGQDATIITAILEGLYMAKDALDDMVVIHGAATGADTVAGNWVAECQAAGVEVEVEACPAPWDIYGDKAGMLRNQYMLNKDPDLVLGFHNSLDESRGTKDMLNRARKAGIPCYLIGRY